MATKVQGDFKVVGYLLSHHAYHQSSTTFAKAAFIARESGIRLTTVRKAIVWLEKSGFIKTGQRDESAPYATLQLGNTRPQYLFSAGSSDMGRRVARWHGDWLGEIFRSPELSSGDKLTAYAVSVATDPRTNLCSVGYPMLVKAVGICERTAKSGVKNLKAAGYLEIDSQPGNGLALYPCLRVATQATTRATTQAMASEQVPDSTEKRSSPILDSCDSYHLSGEGESLEEESITNRRDGGQPAAEEPPWWAKRQQKPPVKKVA
jgi:DNA-binding transcriptional regulator PaaX